MTRLRAPMQSGLQWVRGELDQSLTRARGLLEQNLENPGELLPLQQAFVELHQVRGTAAMIQCFGVAACSEEMKQTVHELMHGQVREREAAYSTLLGATVQLADYLDGLVNGADDCALVLQPVINELRLARGKNVLTESDLFCAQLQSMGLSLAVPDAASRIEGAAQAQAAKLLVLFQQSLLNWLKNNADAQPSLARIGKVAEQVAGNAIHPAIHQLWRSVAACVEALLTQTLEDSIELKRLLGACGQQLRLLAESGEDGAASRLGELPLQLLFYVGRSRGQGPRVTVLRKVFLLAQVLPGQAQLEDLRRRFKGPNTTLLARVSDEIRADLTQVKDSIDIAQRTGGQGALNLDATRARLTRIANTLSMLSQPTLQRMVANQVRALETAGEQGASTELWMEVATALLRVENALEDSLVRSGRPAAGDEAEQQAQKRDLREGQTALYRESLVSLARLKSAVDRYAKTGESEGLVEAGRMLEEVSAALAVLRLERAGGLMAQMQRYLSSPGFARMRDSRPQAERFADAVTLLEVFIEGRRDQNPQADALLDDLAGLVEQFDLADETSRIVITAPPAPPEPPALPASAGTDDPEIREVFLEEAGEVLATLQSSAPRWCANPEDKEALGVIRRAFHTLKGSGRMVGALSLGEFGWALENLLNRVLDGTVAVDAPVLDTVAAGVRELPALIEGFRINQPPGESAQRLEETARQLATGVKPLPAPEPELLEIFREDAREKLDQVAAWAAGSAPLALNDDIPRAFHSLRGAAAVVEARAISELSAALETCLDAVRRAGTPLDETGVLLMREAEAAMRAWVQQGGGDAAPFIARVQALQSAIPDEAAVQAATRRQLAEVFAGEAFDLVQVMEAAAARWATAPSELALREPLTSTAHNLMGAALMSAAPAIAVVCRALITRMGREEQAPDTRFFAQLRHIFEGLYQFLDAYREGTLRDTGAALAVEVEQLVWITPVEPEVLPPVPAPEPLLETPALPMAEEEDLTGIFLGEAQELLEELDRHGAAWQQSPGASQPPLELKRVLHTYKGGARLTGQSALGEAAHLLETRIEQLRGLPDADFFTLLHQVSDQLHQAQGLLRSGHQPDLSGLLATLSASSVENPAPVLPSPPVDEADAELTAIFAGESAQLTEALFAALAQWEAQPQSTEPLREVQRHLHTLKGGARMAGLERMGAAAHDLEERLLGIEAGRTQADGAAFGELRAGFEQLQAMQDALARGNVAELRDAPAEVPVQAPVAAAPASTALPGAGWDAQLFWRPAEDQDSAAARSETARVAVQTLDTLLNQAGEVSIYRSRLDEHSSGLRGQLTELSQAIQRLREQLRMMDIETEAQIAARGMSGPKPGDRYETEFDPLEMDRYTRMQELSRALSESVGDIANLHGAMDELVDESNTLLIQQGRTNTQLQQGLMSTLMVPFSRQAARLQRVVKQTAAESGKQADVVFSGISAELDRNVLERMTAPLEHLLRNAVVHGIETPSDRLDAGKAAQGRVAVSLWRDGTQLLIELRDDGKGLDYTAIRNQAIKRGLMPPDAALPDAELARFIFEPGFSTAKQLTQSAGRGIGMDVVASEVKQLGGTLELGSEPGKGTRFLVRLPLSLALSQALLVGVGGETYAVPLVSVEGIARIPRDQLPELLGEGGPMFPYGGQQYRVRHLADFLGLPREPGDSRTVHAILLRTPEGLGGEMRRIAVVVEQMLGNREIVSKSIGPQLGSIPGIAGATILADGRVVLILDVSALAQERTRRALIHMAGARAEALASGGAAQDLIMVVDDSITIRRVTERLLVKHGFRVLTAKDGLDAMGLLQTERPAAMLLDIEMPRADGFEVAAFVRNFEPIAQLPILMITSRSGDKHRERARTLGVNRYLIKPYQEEQLLGEIRSVLRERAAVEEGA